MLNKLLLTLTILCIAGSAADGAWLSWEPQDPGRDDEIKITLRNCRQGGVMHWGVNAQGKKWKQAIPAYRPAGSEVDGVATRSQLEGPDRYGVCHITIGPFNDTNQVVGTVDFAFELNDGEWDTRGGLDYHIPIYSKRITTDSTNAYFNEPITVRVHNSRPGGELRWGVDAIQSVWQLPHKKYWPKGSVPADDGLAIDTPLPPPDAKGISKIQLGPFNQAIQVVTSLHMAVHWDKDWDTDFGRNYNITVELTREGDERRLSFDSPVRDYLYTNHMTVAVRSAEETPVHLWLDGVPLASIAEPPYAWDVDLTTLDYGHHQLVAHTGSGEDTALATVPFWRVPFVLFFPVDGSFELGPQVLEDGTMSWALHAPGKKFVSIVGDFNNWDPNALLMHRFGDGTWWIRAPMEPGVHQYQYVIDGEKRLADPYSRDVEWKDKDGEETYRPELAKTVFEIGTEPYEWKAEDYERPTLDELIIYEFFIEDFCPGEGFTGVTARLDYLKDLGFNAIEPLPVTEFSGESGWGYNPSFHFAPETSYGTPDELKEMIDECHKRGIAVIGDIVLNHMGGESALHQLYGIHYDQSPYFYLFLGENWGMPDIDQKSKMGKKYAQDVITFWSQEYKMDGFRYDATRWVEWEGYNDWGASWFAYAGRQVDPTSYHIAEHLPTDSELMNTTEMDAGWHAHFRWRLREMISKAELDPKEFKTIIDPAEVGFTNAFQRVTYVESHDEERLMRELEELDMDEDEIVRRAELGLVISITAPGIPMIYGGQEFGENSKRVVGPNALDWNKMDDAPGKRLFKTTRKMVRLKAENAALQADGVKLLVNDPETDTGAYARIAGDTAVVTVANFSREPQTTLVPLPFAVDWTSYLDGKTVTSDAQVSLTLKPGEVKVLTGQKVPAP